MNGSSVRQASHVNVGTGIPSDLLKPGPVRGPVFRHRKLHTELESSNSTELGGLALAARLIAAIKAPREIDDAVSVLRSHRPFFESDHVLTHVYNLFTGGTAIEDITSLQQSEPVGRILGANRIPDPTTAGDFLRRFDERQIRALDHAIDRLHERVWKKWKGRKRSKLGVVDLDSHVHHVYGHQKEGADFTYKGGFGYHPLVISLAETQECLRLVNRSGNVASAQDAAKHLVDLAPLLKSRFRGILVRGDSAFSSQEIFDACEDHGFHFAMVSAQQRNFEALADEIPERRWRQFRAAKQDPNRSKKRRRRKNLRRKQAQKRQKRDLKLKAQWIAEIPYQPARSPKSYRLIVRRQKIEERNQGELFETWRYRFVLTNLPRSVSTEKAVRQTYQRCDQEKVIEQLQNGVAAMKMPTGTLLANHAYLVCARLAHNLKSWLAMLALPEETMRWEWKRFRRSFVYFAARIVTRGRRWIFRVADSHRFANTIVRGLTQLQT